MDPITLKLLIEAGVAGGIGLIVGLEREHSDGVASHSEDHIGVRTLAILALFGWTCALLGERLPWVPPAGLLVAGALVLAHYLRVGDRDLGLTTEVAAATTLALGMLVHYQRDLAVAVGLVVTLLLVAKPWFRRMIPRLRQVELAATVQRRRLGGCCRARATQRALHAGRAASSREVVTSAPRSLLSERKP